MALYRFAAGVIARSRGHSSTAAAAYRAGERLTDERTGETHDYTRRTGVLWTGIYAPKDAPAWTQNREQLWNAVEAAEKRKDAQVARDFIVCIPHELDLEQGRRLVGDFVREQFARKGFVADAAIHAPSKGGDDRNVHAHFLVTMRQVKGGGFAITKDRTQNEKATLLQWREAWAKLANRHLERAGFPGDLDHRSYEAQGIGRLPGQHKTKTAVSMERRGIPTEAGEREKADQSRRQEIADIRAELAELKARQNDPDAAIRPANDPGRPSGHPANDNAPKREPEAALPILRADPPPTFDPAKPVALEPVPERFAVPMPPTPTPTVAKALPRDETAPGRVEVSPQTSRPAEWRPDTSTARPPKVRLAKSPRPKAGKKPKADRDPSHSGFRAVFAVATGLARSLMTKGRTKDDRKPAEAPRPKPAPVVSQRPVERPATGKSAATFAPTPTPVPQRPAAVIQGMAKTQQKPAEPTPPSPLPPPLTPDELRAALAEQERAFGQDLGGFDF